MSEIDFRSRLIASTETRNSWLCVGLDPVKERLPENIPDSPAGVREFCTAIIEATAPYACAYKPNIAFFEALGRDGWDVLGEVIDAVPDDIPVILDAKRGDIGNTAERYAEAYYGVLDVDAVTVNPYMGWDAVKPFAEWPGKAAIVLCLTSNPAASEIQMMTVQEELYTPETALEMRYEPLYLQMARIIHGWGASCGLVVGATKASHLKDVRSVAPDEVLLIPGVGAQGGDLEKSVRYGSWEGGGGALINASRSILYASSGDDFAEAAAEAADELRSGIQDALQR